MNVATRLIAYVALLVVVFLAAFLLARALAPEGGIDPQVEPGHHGAAQLPTLPGGVTV